MHAQAAKQLIIHMKSGKIWSHLLAYTVKQMWSGSHWDWQTFSTVPVICRNGSGQVVCKLTFLIESSQKTKPPKIKSVRGFKCKGKHSKSKLHIIQVLTWTLILCTKLIPSDSNCCLLACNWAFFNSLPGSSLCCGLSIPCFISSTLPSLCYGDSNCHLLACNWMCFSSLPSLCCGDSNHCLLVSNWACFSSLPSLKITVETPLLLIAFLSFLWWNFAFFVFFLWFCTLSHFQ